ncbi:MAG: hypothetical protein PHY28_10590 [Dehalococcoidales bacterium]|nr:hypothetical protein [Dehalococcoidales bacterium]
MARESKWHKIQVSIKKAIGVRVILCDSCKWDWRGACHNPERPNATWCPEYKNKNR